MDLNIRAEDWAQVRQDLLKFDPALYRSLRKTLRDVGQIGVDGVREMLAMGSPDGGPDEGTNRAALAAGTRAAVSFAKRGGSVRIVTSGSKLSAEHRALLAAYNTRSWRHPVFGNRDNWDDQAGRPYFYGPIRKAGKKEMAEGIQAAVNDAVRAMGAR